MIDTRRGTRAMRFARGLEELPVFQDVPLEPIYENHSFAENEDDFTDSDEE